MEFAEEMDVEGGISPATNNFKRFSLKNSIQTNFGDDYVFQIVSKDDWTSMAASLSTNTVKLYSPQTGQYIGECGGHSSTIHQISFSGPSSPHVLYSCSSDGTLRAWDSRSFQQVSCISTGPSQDIFSFSFGGASGDLLAAACKSQILFWDWRTTKQAACLEESHTEDVTQVQFIPGQQNHLVSSSVDGLICLFDICGDINDDDHMISVLNVGTSIGKFPLAFGIGVPIELKRTLRMLEHWPLIVGHWIIEEDRLLVIGGTNGGTLGYFPVEYGSRKMIGSAEAVFQGGHTGIVRSVLPVGSCGIFGWTGGEDGRLCCWLSDDSVHTNSSWVSSALVEKTSKTRRKSRHSP